MAEIQFGHNSPLPRLSRCQVEISQEPRGRSLLHFWLSVISSPSHVFPPPYGHNDMSGDRCQCWYGGDRYCGNQGNHWLVVETSILTQEKLDLSFNVWANLWMRKLAACREIQTEIRRFGGKSGNLGFQEVRSWGRRRVGEMGDQPSKGWPNQNVNQTESKCEKERDRLRDPYHGWPSKG